MKKQYALTAVPFLLFLLILLAPTLMPFRSLLKSALADQVRCTLVVPSDPLQNLTTPWTLQAPCHESNPVNSVFVQAVIYDRDTHKLTTYNPLVIDQGTSPAIAPVPLVLSNRAIVGLFGGGNDDVTRLSGDGSDACTNGADGIPFGQVFYCHTKQLFQAINQDQIAIPQLGIDNKGATCPSVRSFKIVDQDQSDNVQTTYLFTRDGRTAQNTASNRLALGGAVAGIAKNPSDNRLLTNFVDPAIGCNPWKIPDIGDKGNVLPTQATDELQAAAYQQNPIALIPLGDPMVGPNNLDMVNAYRVSIDQNRANSPVDASTLTYCKNLKAIAPGFLSLHAGDFTGKVSPAPGVDLNTFIQERYQASLQILGC